MPRQQIYGNSTIKFPSNIDHVVVTNEDMGLTAALTTGTNDTFETTIPYPQEWDPEDEVMTIYEMQFDHEGIGFHADDEGAGLLHWLAMIDRAATATYRGVGVDAEDEWIKSQFTPRMYSGRSHITPTGTSAQVTLVSFELDALYTAIYRPKLPIPTFFPVYHEVSNQNITVAAATGDETAATYSAGLTERTKYSYDYTIRKMNSRERRMMQGLPGVQQRWGALGS